MSAMGRNKGKRGEYLVRDSLAEWLGIPFRRTPGSGSFASTTGYDALAGDVVCDDPTFKFSIEVKNVEGWKLEHLLTSDKNIIRKWWEQAKSQCPENKKPILIFTKNRSPLFCVVKDNDLGVDVVGFKLTSDLQETLNIFLFTELVKLDKSIMFDAHNCK